MEITKNLTIRNKYHQGFARTSEPDTVVIHGTAGPGTLKWMEGTPIASNGKNYADWYVKGIGLFHYLIEKSGKIIEVIQPDNWVYASNSGKIDEKNINIELVNDDFNNGGDYTNLQYDSLNWLVFVYLRARYNITIIASHDRFRKKFQNLPPKPCPGPLFKWEYIEDFMKEIGLKFAHVNGLESYWDIKRI